MRILAIETSCDETSAAVIEKKQSEKYPRIVSCTTSSSMILHQKIGGIIPETAAREQVKWIIPVIMAALLASKTQHPPKDVTQRFTLANQILKNTIDAIAVTVGPGLIGSLLVGVETAKTLSYALSKPLIPVHHLIGHLYGNFIQDAKAAQNSKSTSPIRFPFVGLVVSGGHTDLLLFSSHKKYKWLGGTRDDAAGEALDKIGRLLGLPYPGGPEIEKRAQGVHKSSFSFKSPMIGTEDFDFSFSGLKTEVLRFFQKAKGGSLNEVKGGGLTPRGWPNGLPRGEFGEEVINQICFAAQKAIFDVLIKKTLQAAEQYNAKSIVLGGGVAANQTLRDQFRLKIENCKLKINFFAPAKNLCTDNAAMIGAAACFQGLVSSWKKVSVNPELYFE